MTPQEIQKLLGGYATGTLTEAEQQALFEAALHDQTLFDALAGEQSLRDLLSDPAARAHLLSALEPPPPRRFWTWRPVVALAAMAAVATVAIVVVRRPSPVLVGQALPPANPIVHSQPAVVQEVAPAAPAAKPRRKSAAPAVAKLEPAPAPASPPPPPPAAVSGAVVEVPKVAAAANKVEEQVAVAAAAPALPPVVTTRTNLMAADNAAAPAPQLRIAAPGARQIFFGAQPLAAAPRAFGAVNAIVQQPAANLAVRYTILRRDAAGAFVEAERSDLSPSDTVELRFTANATGYLTVGDATPVSLTAMDPYTTPPLTAIPAELKIIFAPQPQRQALPAASIMEVQYRDTYVANRVPGQPVTFTIKLP
jgi:hypothetical protein